MKTRILLLGLLFSITLSFAQQNWGNWVTNPCYNFIQTRVKVNGPSSPIACGEKPISYDIEIKNSSSKNIHFEFGVFSQNNSSNYICENGQIKLVSYSSGTRSTSYGGAEIAMDFRKIKSGEIVKIHRTLLRGGNIIFLQAFGVKFEKSECYEKCSNGQECPECIARPNQAPCCNTSNTDPHTKYENNTNSNNQQNKTVTNSPSEPIQNNQIVIEPDKSYEMTKQVFEISNNFVNAMQAQAVIEEKNNANIQNKELIKLEIESDFNNINSPEDFDKVTLTSITYKNLIKLSNIEVRKECGSAFANPETINVKAKTSSKIEAAFLGANTVVVKNFDVSRDNRYSYNRCVFEIFGFAQTNKVLNFEEIQKVLATGKYEILKVYKFKKNDDEFSKEKFTKDIEITKIEKNGNFIEITANTKNTKNDKFRLINFNENQFVLFYQEKDKLFNYIIKTN